MRFLNKTAVITGGASGIGLAAVQRFHAEGANVVIADIDGSSAAAAAERLGHERCCARQVNVADFSQVNDLMNFAVERFRTLDVLVNNAAAATLASAPNLKLEDWQRAMDVGPGGAFYGCKAAIPIMRRRGGGVIINTASISGLAGDFSLVSYNAAKGAVINLTRSVAIDHAREGIRVNALCPGPIRTPPLEASLKNVSDGVQRWENVVPMGRLGTPNEMAAVMAFLASEDASYITGAIITADGGLTAHTGAPRF